MKKSILIVIFCLTLAGCMFLVKAKSYALANNAQYYPGLNEHDIALLPGFNFISIPYMTPNRSISGIFGPLLNQGVDLNKWTGGQNWIWYSDNPSLFSDIGISDAVFVKTNEYKTLKIKGYDIDDDLGFVEIKEGWNQFGLPISTEMNIKDIKVIKGEELFSYTEAAQKGLIQADMWGFTPENQSGYNIGLEKEEGLNDENMLYPGKGYEILSLVPDPLVLVFDKN